jgi:hypothetical protein
MKRREMKKEEQKSRRKVALKEKLENTERERYRNKKKIREK